MTKIITKITTIILSLITLNGCILGTVYGNGQVVSSERQLNNFYEVNVGFVGDVYIRQGHVQQVIVSADSNLIDLITTRVNQGVLTIDSSTNYSSAGNVKVEITVPDLDRVYLTGVGDVDIIDFETNRINLITDGVGSIRATGQVITLNAEVHGVGDLNLRDLLSLDATALVDGVGNIEIYANRTLDLRVDGVGDITYYGKAVVTTEDDGVGTIRKGD